MEFTPNQLQVLDAIRALGSDASYRAIKRYMQARYGYQWPAISAKVAHGINSLRDAGVIRNTTTTDYYTCIWQVVP